MIPSTVYIPLLILAIGILLYVYPYEQQEGFAGNCIPNKINIVFATSGDSWVSDKYRETLDTVLELARKANADGTYTFKYPACTLPDGSTFINQQDYRLRDQQRSTVAYNCGERDLVGTTVTARIGETLTVTCPQPPECRGVCIPQPIYISGANFGDAWVSDRYRETLDTVSELARKANADGSYSFRYAVGTLSDGSSYNNQADYRLRDQQEAWVQYSCGGKAQPLVRGRIGQYLTVTCPQPTECSGNRPSQGQGQGQGQAPSQGPSQAQAPSPSPSPCPSVSPVPSPSPCPIMAAYLSKGRNVNSPYELQRILSIYLNNLDLLEKKLRVGYVQLGIEDEATLDQQKDLYMLTQDKHIYDSKFVEEKSQYQTKPKERKQTLQEFVFLFLYISFAIFAIALSVSSYLDNNRSIFSALSSLVFSALMCIAMTAFIVRLG